MAKRCGLALGALVLLGALCGCATPLQRAERLAGDAGFSMMQVAGEGFQHLVYLRRNGADSPLHVYIEGDGLPWLTEDIPSEDPTPHDPLALRLMRHDPHSSVYLGRPCYFEQPGKHCQLGLWTMARYSPMVVRSMAVALSALRNGRATPDLILIGYSGGGSLAALLADELEGVRGVITLAANLDTEAWVQAHGYSPLRDSLNPATRLPVRNLARRERHYFGAADRNAGQTFAVRYFDTHPAARSEAIAGFDHRCCWERAWPQLLDRALRGFREAGVEGPLSVGEITADRANRPDLQHHRSRPRE